ncbi:MAG: HAMP domain-containing histidine kinase [Clostridia bacterium]|nr:HAMP domain-containing histidine kinase [Clostridia bacterium]
MFNRFKKLCKTIYFSDLKSIPSEQRVDFFNEITSINYNRIKPLGLSLIVINFILLILDFTVFKRIGADPTGYKGALTLHIAGLLFYCIISILLYFFFHRLSLNLKRFVLVSFIVLSLFWCQMISLQTIRIYGQAMPVIICMLTTSYFFVLNQVDRIALFGFSYVSMNLLLMTVEQKTVTQAGSLVTMTFLLFFCLFVSKVNYTVFVDNFINRRIIINNIKEIGKLNAELERKVHERTEALTQANAQIELEKLRVSFFTNLSHEFRTPINVILAAQQLLELKLKNALPHKDYKSIERNLHSIRQYSYRLMRLASNLIDMTRIDAGYYGLTLKNVDIVHVAEEIVLSVASFVESRGIQIIFDTQTEELIMAVDVDKIERAILNLLSNAVKFTPKKGLILVSLFEDEGKVYISVKDNGIGIPSEMTDDIFSRFVQVDQTLTRNREGSGLGLSIVKSIIELHGGTISVRSALYQGSEFIISLPLHVLKEDDTVSAYSFEGQASLDMLNIEFSDIET